MPLLKSKVRRERNVMNIVFVHLETLLVSGKAYFLRNLKVKTDALSVKLRLINVSSREGSKKRA